MNSLLPCLQSRTLPLAFLTPCSSSLCFLCPSQSISPLRKYLPQSGRAPLQMAQYVVEVCTAVQEAKRPALAAAVGHKVQDRGRLDDAELTALQWGGSLSPRAPTLKAGALGPMHAALQPLMAGESEQVWTSLSKRRTRGAGAGPGAGLGRAGPGAGPGTSSR